MNSRASFIGLALVIAVTSGAFGQAKYSAKRPKGLLDRISYSKTKSTPVRQVSHGRHTPGCGCEAPAVPACGCEAPRKSCCNTCRPCCGEAIRNFARGVGNFFHCLLPCTPCGPCGPRVPRCGCKSALWVDHCNGCSGCNGGSHQVIEGEVMTDELVPPAVPQDARRSTPTSRAPWQTRKPSPYRATGRQSTKVRRGVPTPAKPTTKRQRTATVAPSRKIVDEKPPVIRVSYSSNEAPAAAPKKTTVKQTKKSNHRLNFNVPVNPLR